MGRVSLRDGCIGGSGLQVKRSFEGGEAQWGRSSGAESSSCLELARSRVASGRVYDSCVYGGGWVGFLWDCVDAGCCTRVGFLCVCLWASR